MRLKSGYEDRKARMEMISLMDIMFLILVVFVYAVFSMSVHRGLKVDLPSADGPLLKGEKLVITLSADDTLALNKEPMSFDDLVLATITRWRENPVPVLISADRAATLGTGIELLGKLKNGGVEQVTFQVSGEARTPTAGRAAPPDE
ncbi:MAG: biopolymer transporter ExbD [Kiritimatiellae bacterium]|jgi:biopolymer transport protein ExbD|nr:biopolymer transporter ExbD [Kiritimatiellia bacterium]MDD2349299.1 biopolymer transporter ExbD [Kiritimatiellia bacterium]MDD3583492.1 biopolymer transporter ExbD [Kiritimatiellia bacterium]HHU15551.1 biopolymer transporter ExbD [Lentisphaerota bacterium]